MLRREFDRIQGKHPEYDDDDAFTYWWIQAVHDLSDADAEKAVKGKSHDKGIDAIWIDYEQQIVFLVQAKCRKWFFERHRKAHNEKRTDIFQLPNMVAPIFWDEAEKNNYFQTLDAGIKAELIKAIKQVKNQKYKIQLRFITTGKVGKDLEDEAVNSAKRKAKKDSRGKVEVDYSISAYQKIENQYMDWDEYGAPEIGDYKIPIVKDHTMPEAIIEHKDPNRKLETWIGTVNSKKIGKMYEVKGRRIFETNIRAYLDKTRVNTAMIETIQNQPQNFWYYNNGITIICDKMSTTRDEGVTSWNLEKPQIINGQQTTITLSENNDVDANVIIKGIKVPRDEPSRDNLISNIVKATNWQNPIDFSDLVSNDVYQKGLERKLKPLKYFYVRKKHGKIDYARQGLDYSIRLTIHKKKMAEAVGACILDPAELRKGKKVLFDEQKHYLTLFRKPDVNFFVSCYLSRSFVEKFRITKKGQDDYSRWFNIHLLWNQLRDTIQSGDDAKRFRILHENAKIKKYKTASNTIRKLIRQNYKMTSTFYRKTNAGKNPSNFYKQSGLPDEFEKFSKKENKQEMKKAERLVKDFKQRLKRIQLT